MSDDFLSASAPDDIPAERLFARAAWYLNDYLQLRIGAGFDAADEDEAQAELKRLCERLNELHGQWERKVATDCPTNTAAILASMLADWKLPGSVWYSARAQRYRLTGETYRPEDGETCLGVYTPGSTAEAIAEDIAAMLAEQQVEVTA